MSYLSYTILADSKFENIKAVANLYGDKATAMLQVMRDVAGREVSEGDVVAGCRIDRIGSEDFRTNS